MGVLHAFSALLLPLSICFYFYQFTPRLPVAERRWITLAFLFCLIGDGLMLWSQGTLFLQLGVLAFGLVHLILIGQHLHWYKSKFDWTTLLVILLGGLGLFFVSLNLSIPTSFVIPIYVYSFLMLLHLSLAQANYQAGTVRAWVVWGVGALIVSSIALAVQEFGPMTGKYWSMGLMVVYALALFLLMIGFKRREPAAKEMLNKDLHQK